MRNCFFGCVILAMILGCARGERSSARVPMCFERITSRNGISDRLKLEVEIAEDSLTGRLDWLPQEKDSQRGTIKGIRSGTDKFSVQYEFTAEGQNNTEKQTISIEKDIAVIVRQHDGGAASVTSDTLISTPCLHGHKH